MSAPPTPRECILSCFARDSHREARADAILSALAAAGYAVVPKEPTPGLLVSMAMRYRHDFGFDASSALTTWGVKSGTTDAERTAILGTMKQLHEEVVGTGFYSPDREANYRAMLAAAAQEDQR